MSYDEDRAFRNYINNTETCTKCAGTGRRGMIGGLRCEDCNGRGRIATHVQLDPISGRIPLKRQE